MEYVDSSGNKVTVSLEGQFTRERIQKLVDTITAAADGAELARYEPRLDSSTVFGKLALLIEEFSSEEWVASALIRDAFSKRYGEDISQPVVSTYLSRLVRAGLVERKGGRANVTYRPVKSQPTQSP